MRLREISTIAFWRCKDHLARYAQRVNPKRFVLALLVVFVGVWVTDFLIHGVALKGAYAATQSLWRPEAEMVGHMGWMILGQFVAALAFVLLWALGFADKGRLGCGVLYGLIMGLFSQATTLITYAVQPLPGCLALQWSDDSI
jgi:hypothetical protein